MAEMPTEKKTANLRAACIAEAIKIIDAKGVENLSLREVARRLGVSHQAPYKHFPSRDHILAEIVRQAFETFSAFLEARDVTGDPVHDFAEMGRAYLRFAESHPLQYRLIMNADLPRPDDYPEMLQSAQRLFSLVISGLESFPTVPVAEGKDEKIDFDALFVLSVMHGFSSMHGSPLAGAMRLTPEELASATPEILKRIAKAIGKVGTGPAPPN
jgi:AcrR family transcriptional regulator